MRVILLLQEDMTTTLAQDIEALVKLGHTLEIATQLAVAHRNRPQAQPGNISANAAVYPASE